MNAGPADTRSPHLDLEDLIAEVTGQGIDGPAREHLARCEHCRAEANRWDLVAGGVRELAAATLPPAQPARPIQPARPASPPPTRPRMGFGPRTRLAASVAAAVVLIGAVGYGASSFIHIKFGTAGTGAGPALVAVGGCTGLEQASGTLRQVNGSNLVINLPSDRPLAVTTTASTFVSMTGASGALLSDITDGASVVVRGHSSGGTIAAAIITVGPPFGAVNPLGYVPVRGTVADASTGGFTLVTSGGTRVPVTTSGSTIVIIPHASLGQLRDGAIVYAIGHVGPRGTLSARAVAQLVQPPAGAQVHTSVRGCSPASLAAGFFPGG
jgi:hypothetical protein